MEFLVIFQPFGKKALAKKGDSIHAAAREAGLELSAPCGGKGRCEKCVVQIVEGRLTQPTPTEKEALGEVALREGFRLACQAYPESDVSIFIPDRSIEKRQRIQLEGKRSVARLNSAVTSIASSVHGPAPNDSSSDQTRTEKALGATKLDSGLFHDFPVTLGDLNWQVKTALSKDKSVSLIPADASRYGLAFDYGTTSIIGYLVDIERGKLIDSAGCMNPQIPYGEDIISRISFASRNALGGKRLQRCLIDATNDIIDTLCARYNIQKSQLVDMVAVGNTAIHHMLYLLPLYQLAVAPFVPAVYAPMELDTKELGINMASGARIFSPGNIAGFVGADHVSMLLSSGILGAKKTILAIDIGTNTEMTLKTRGRYFCCSCASGPAFEGAHLQDGMRAAAGAIERVLIDSEVIVNVIDDVAPIGICGSGILDAVAELRRNGILDARGRFAPGSQRVVGLGKDARFILSPASHNGHGRDIAITKRDINEIMLAKGAIRAGIDILLEISSTAIETIDEILIAGAFGSYIDIGSAIRIRMLPSLPFERYRQIGNAAGMGAIEMLIDTNNRLAAAAIADKLEYIELTKVEAFGRFFSSAIPM